ncbi:MAG: hypothetical protein RBU23_04200 [Candidatus Auribacterota bacterium]|jgi:cellobiose phosphorylase/cellobionic acid phosphorylase|nr:hypothetical protein [Candidatus Auribacterota bacterium]
MNNNAHLNSQVAKTAYEKLIDKIRANLKNGEPQLEGLSESEIDALKSRYSHFDDSCFDDFLTKSFFSINTVDLPKGWYHYMINLNNVLRPVVVSVCAQDGAGCLSQDSVLFGPITKLSGNENYMHVAQVYRNTRNVWIKSDIGEVFPINPQQNLLDAYGVRQSDKYDEYRCVQEPGSMEIRSRRDGIEGSFRLFVPYELPCEIWVVNVRNCSDKSKNISIYPEINFGLDSHPSHYFVGMAVSEADYDSENTAIIAKNLDIKNSFPRWGAFIASDTPAAFDSNADTYYGFGASIPYPPSLFKNRLADNEAKQPLKGMIGAFQYDLSLSAGEDKTLYFAVAAIDPAKDVNSQVRSVRKMLTKDAVEKELTRVRNAWQNIFDSFLIKTPSKELDRTFNIWGKYQSIICSRFNSPYDIGTRDMFQYLLANCLFEPNYVKLTIPYLVNFQYKDGRIPRQISKFSTLHDLRNFMDCQLWLPDLLSTYLKETGDFSLIDREVGFLLDDNKTLSDEYKASIYEHAMLAVKSAYENNIGNHGLCRLGYGGWNDALDGLRGHNSESVWLSQLLVFAAKKMREIACFKNDKDTVTYLDNIIKKVSDAINSTGWDEAGYYIFGYDDNGNPVGSSRNEEGRKHLNENSWALLSGVACENRVKQIVNAMESLDTPFGMRLLEPYSKKSSVQVGRIADQAQGHFENGSVYQHGALFYATALLQAGYIDDAWHVYRLLTNENRIPDITTNPPTYHSNYTAVPDNNDYGKEPYYPFTGSHAWRMMFVMHMIGLKPEFDRMVIDPKLPAVWKHMADDRALVAKIRKKSHRIEHTAVTYTCEIYRDDSVPDGTMRVTINGNSLEPVDGVFFIPYTHEAFGAEDGKERLIDIKVYL